MKKVVLCVAFVLALLCCFAQKVRTVAEIPFDGEFRYFNVDPENDSGSIPGVSNLHAFDGRVYFINATTGNWYCVDSRGSIKEVWHIEDAKDGWSKVQRLDGITVWIETKYIDF